MVDSHARYFPRRSYFVEMVVTQQRRCYILALFEINSHHRLTFYHQTEKLIIVLKI